MTSFDATNDQKAFVDAVHKYAENDLRHHMRDADEARKLNQSVLDTGWMLGIVQAGIPESHGGFSDQQATVTAVLAYEELAWGDLSAALHLLTPTLLAYPIRQHGSSSQQNRYLPTMCATSPPALTAALLEPHYQFSPYQLNTTARLDQTTYVLDGVKIYCPLAEQADTILIYAKDTASNTSQAFLVARENPGLHVGERENLMGVKALPTYPITLTNCRVKDTSRVGHASGLHIIDVVTRTNLALAALAVGISRAALEYSIDYAKDRTAFGEPIASRQSIAFMLAEMAMEIDATRLMVWEAASMLDKQMDALENSVLVRQYSDEMVVKVTDSAVQILGGHGYIREHPVELWLRNARGFSTFDGLAVV